MKNYPLYHSPYSTDLRTFFQKAVERYADKDLFVYRRNGRLESVGYRAFAERVAALGAALEAEGLFDGRMAILGENSPEWLLCYFAIGCGGGVAVPLDREQTEENLAQMLTATECGVLFFSADYADLAAALSHRLPRRLRCICFGEQSELPEAELLEALLEKGRKALAAGDRRYEERPVDPEGMLEIIFTSGTTSTSKAVQLSHHNVVSNACYSANMVDIRHTDRVLAPLPFHHTYQLTCGILNMINQGCTIFINRSVRYLVQDIAAFRPTIVVVVPLMLEMILQKIQAGVAAQGKEKLFGKLLSVIRVLQRLGLHPSLGIIQKIKDQLGGEIHTFICGGAPLAPSVVETFGAMNMQVVQGYGITECSPLVAVNRNRYYKTDSIGLPIPGCEVKIEDGEILVRGEGVMAGYYNNPEETAASFRDGWFCTGDLGRQDADGFLYITGRKKNLIVLKNGKNVSPEDLEADICACPYVKECVVYGVENGSNADLTLSATIYPDFEQETLKGLPTHEVHTLINEEITALNKRLPFYKQVHQVKFRETEFPKTTTKKIKRSNAYQEDGSGSGLK
ncbi:MAG: AMP-dependent synthetase [Clostridiales bacterium]|nr:MAG: AMP-dependent synthetase [Clostridiales bacterium]